MSGWPPRVRSHPRSPLDDPTVPFAFKAGRAVADGERAYDSIQRAIDNASGVVLVGAGTFSESVTISTAGLDVIGVGTASRIESDTGVPVTIGAGNVTLSNLQVESIEGSGGEAIMCNFPKASIRDIDIPHSDAQAIEIGGDNCTVDTCFIHAADSHGVLVTSGNQTKVNNCRVGDPDLAGTTISGTGIECRGQRSIIEGNFVHGVDQDGIGAEVAEIQVIGNRVHNSTIGIYADNSTPIITNNIIRNYTTAIDTASATSPVVANNVEA